MNIEEFVSQSLEGITNGLKKSNSRSNNAKPFTLDHDGVVEFDIATTVIESGETSGGTKAEIKVATFINLGGGIEKSKNASNESYSKMKFKVTYDNDELQKMVNSKKLASEPYNPVEESSSNL